MTSKLFIGNLPYSCTEEDLRAIFESAGTEPVDVRVIIDRGTGLSKGFGFVEMADYDAAIWAKGALTGACLGGRNLVVDLAKPSGTGKISR